MTNVSTAGRATGPLPQAPRRGLYLADVVETLQVMPPGEAARQLAHMPDARAVGALDRPEFTSAPDVVALLPPARAVRLVSEMAEDRVADLLAAMAPTAAAPILAALAPDVRRSLRLLLAWPADSAGGMMTTEYVASPADATVAAVLDHVRTVERSRETVYLVFLLGPGDRLVATVSMRRLIAADPAYPALDLARGRDPVSVLPECDREHVAALIRRHDLLALPVVDAGGRLLGIVIFGSLVGSMLPFVLQRLGFDPASASAPFVATLVDVTGLVIYFSIALAILSGTLLKEARMGFSLHSTGFSDALVILGAAGLVIPAVARLRINPVIGFILVGVLVGPAGLGSFVDRVPWLFFVTISDPHAVEPFAEFGIVLLLFSIGLELSFRRLWTMRRTVFGVGTGELFLSAGALAGLGLLLGYPVAGSAGVAVALALSSTALVISIAGTSTPVGRAAFAMLLFEDLALVPILFALAALRPDTDGAALAAMGGTLLRGGAVVVALLVFGRLALPRVFAQAARAKSPELFLSASLLVVILASVATSVVGLSPIVGALIAGILIAETDYHHEVEVITAPFKGLALGIFLITVGMRLDLRQVADAWPALLGATAAVIAVKGAVTGGLLRLLGFRAAVAAETSLLMAAPSETTLIVLGTAAAAGLIDGATAQFWQTCTALGLTVTPLLAQFGRLAGRTLDGRQPIPPVDDIATPGQIVVVGYGRVGELVVDMLRRHDRRFRVVDADVDAVARAHRDGVPITFGDVRRGPMLDQLGLERAQAVVLTMDDPVQLMRTTQAVRRRHRDLPIIARARHAGHAAELYRAGATEAVPETLEASLQLSGAALVEVGVAMGPVIASIHAKRAELRDRIMTEGDTDRGDALRRW